MFNRSSTYNILRAPLGFLAVLIFLGAGGDGPYYDADTEVYGSVEVVPVCTEGCPCGPLCIDCSATCEDGDFGPDAEVYDEVTQAITCRKGCQCGESCIDCSKKCHKGGGGGGCKR